MSEYYHLDPDLPDGTQVCECELCQQFEAVRSIERHLCLEGRDDMAKTIHDLMDELVEINTEREMERL